MMTRDDAFVQWIGNLARPERVTDEAMRIMEEVAEEAMHDEIEERLQAEEVVVGADCCYVQALPPPEPGVKTVTNRPRLRSRNG